MVVETIQRGIDLSMFNSGSMEENRDRLDVLYRKHHKLFMGTAYNITKNEVIAEDLVGDLYLYLSEKIRQKLWYRDSFNLLYCINFLQTRWINKAKRDKKIKYSRDISDNIEDIEYDSEFDNKLDTAYESVLEEIKRLQQTNMWTSAKLYSLFWIENPDMTLKQLSETIGISNSTSFIHIKKVKQHLKQTINNPFK